MSNLSQSHRNDERKDETPPYSRIFIVCSKDLNEDVLRTAFEKYGEIENLYIPVDRNTGSSRGVAFIKYSKTSSAAAAIDALNLKTIGNNSKPIKVMVASKKDSSVADNNSNVTHDRIFVKISKQTTEDEIREYFSKFGSIESMLLLKEKSTNENKGLAFVQFRTFLEAAIAIESCDKKYKAVFAEPKQELKRSRDDRHPVNDNFNPYNTHMTNKDNFADYYNDMPLMNNMSPLMINNVTPLIKTPPQNYKAIIATCTPIVAQRHLQRLFNIVPGMQHFQYNEDSFNGYSRALVKYEDERAAAHAVDRLNNYEFPSGELVTVKPDNPLSKAAEDLTNILSSFKTAVDNGSPELLQLADAIAQASTLIKAATTGSVNSKQSDGIKLDSNLCSVPLPMVQPLARPMSTVAKRCFIVCKPQPPPQHIMQDLFCRFGDLIDLTVFPKKTFAFASFASEKSAQDAIKTLHGATVCGMVMLKVMEAEEHRPHKDKDQRSNADEDCYMEHDGDTKRKRLNDKPYNDQNS